MLVVVGALILSGTSLVFPERTAEATFPGYNGLVVFSSSAYRGTMTMRGDGSGLRPLEGVGTDSDPAWSPDGQQIAFGPTWIWVADADGTNQRQLISGSETGSSPAWSPDGSKIAYSGMCEFMATSRDVCVVDAAGGDPEKLYGSADEDEHQPAWSPDGSKIAFVTNVHHTTAGRTGDIYVMDADGTDVGLLTKDGEVAGFPDWSPDGSKILYTRYLPVKGLYTMSPDGSDVTQLVGSVLTLSNGLEVDLGDGPATWSPDGKYIIFGGETTWTESNLFRVRSDGAGAPVQLTDFHERHVGFHPDWQAVSEPPSPYGEFTSLTPARVLDTRDGNGRGGVAGPLGEDESFEVQITGRGGVADTGVAAVVMNVTVTQPTTTSWLAVWPAGEARPLVSNLNYVPGQTVPNLVTVAVGDAGRVEVYNRFGSTHVISDVVGYYADDTGPSGSRFDVIDPYRFFDTRDGTGGVGVGPVGTEGVLKFNVTGKGGVPGSGVSAVMMNVTVTEPTAWSYLTVYPGDVDAPPLASNLNYVPGLTVPNLVVVGVPSSGVINFYNRFGTVHVIADVVGFYHDDTVGEAGRFIGFTPSREFDSRIHSGSPLGPDASWVIGDFPGFGGVPLGNAEAVVLNVTATQPTEWSYLTVFPSDLCELPLASNLNFVAGRTVPNHVVVRVGNDDGCGDFSWVETISLYNRFGHVHVVIDLFGIFSAPTILD